MKELPIIFSAPMVCALLDGRKTQTRRILKPQPQSVDGSGRWYAMPGGGESLNCHRLPYAVGDRLWVREAWAQACELDDDEKPASELKSFYRADGEPFSHWLDPDNGQWRDGIKWGSPIHMPRWASRITLEVTEVRVQRLQEISEEDARAEGIFKFFGIEAYGYDKKGMPARHAMDTARDTFAALWASIHGPDAWAANPWLAAISFKRITRVRSPYITKDV